MAGNTNLRPVLGAVRKAWGRSSSNLRAIAGNNMTYAGFTLLFMMAPSAMVLFSVLMGLVLFLPASGDPFALVPRERLQLWPLSDRDRRLLRVIAPWFNPLTWLMLGALIWKRVGWDLWAFVALFFFAGFFGAYLPDRNIRLAVGPPLVRLHLRQILYSLDLYCALLLSIPALYFRLAGRLPEAASLPLTMLMLVILSTIALTMFGMDGEGGLVRYRLLPVAGWKILAAKGIPFLAVLTLLSMHLAPVAAFAGGCILLSFGNLQSVRSASPQRRWRLRASNSFAFSVLQMVSVLLAAGAADRWHPIAALPCLLLYVISLAWCGRRLSKESPES